MNPLQSRKNRSEDRIRIFTIIRNERLTVEIALDESNCLTWKHSANPEKVTEKTKTTKIKHARKRIRCILLHKMYPYQAKSTGVQTSRQLAKHKGAPKKTVKTSFAICLLCSHSISSYTGFLTWVCHFSNLITYLFPQSNFIHCIFRRNISHL